MNRLKKWISLLLCVCMLAGAAAFAEGHETHDHAEGEACTDEVTIAVPSTVQELPDDTIVAILSGQNVTWADVKDIYNSFVSSYGASYDMTQTEIIDLFRAVALQNAIVEALIQQKAEEFGLDQLTEEEIAALHASSDEQWEAIIGDFIVNSLGMMDGGTQEEWAQAQLIAESYYGEMGYTAEIFRELTVKYEIFDRVQLMITQDAFVTDEEVEAAYQAKVAADRELYGNDIAAYIDYNSYVDQMGMYAMMYGMPNEMEYAWYKPEGFRAVKHILLPVDGGLMDIYNDLQAQLEEQLDAEASYVQGGAETGDEAADAEAEAAAEPEREPVTPADIDNAKADILASLADKTHEIYEKIDEGVAFDELIAMYGVNDDGSPSDPGMFMEPYMTGGYEVAGASENYVQAFVDAAFSVNSIGEVSAPYLSSFGVHIVKYIGDVPAGPIEMTVQQREASRAAMLENKKADLYSATMDGWLESAGVEYTGVIPSIEELQSQEDDWEDDMDEEDYWAYAEEEEIVTQP